MADRFEGAQGGLSDPPREAFAITPNDGADLAVSTRYLYVGAAGNIVCDFVGLGSSITLVGVPVGIHALRLKRVRATGTTAGSLVGLV
jgi:hypothetical protein